MSRTLSLEIPSVGQTCQTTTNPIAVSTSLQPPIFDKCHVDFNSTRQVYRSTRLRHGRGAVRDEAPYHRARAEDSRALMAASDRWQSASTETLFSNRNLPPLINKKAIDAVLMRNLILVTDVSGNLGSLCFIVGSFYFYPEYGEGNYCGNWDCITLGSVLFIIGSFFFLVGSCANFVKNDAWSCEDVGLTVNAILYVFANFLFTAGSVFFIPDIAEIRISEGLYHDEFLAESIGLSAFVFGSVVFILAPMYDMYRAHQLRGKRQISDFSFVVECFIATLYIGGSILFLVGSIFFIPFIFERFAVTMFVVGSFCFQGACISSPAANLYRYFNRILQVRALNRRRQQLLLQQSLGADPNSSLSSRNDDVLDAGHGDLSVYKKRKRTVGFRDRIEREAVLQGTPKAVERRMLDILEIC